MSTGQHWKFSFWTDFATELRSIEITHTKQVLRPSDQDTSRDALLLWCMIIEDLEPTQPQGKPVTDRLRRIRPALIECLRYHAVDQIIDTLMIIDDGLLSPHTRMLSTLSAWFEPTLGELPKGFCWLRDVFYVARGETFVSTFRRWHQCACFLSRLTLNISSLQEEATRTWVATQEAVSENVDPGVTSVIARTFSRIRPDVRCGSHGNGASYLHQCDGVTTRSPVTKYENSCWTPMIRLVTASNVDDPVIHPFGTEIAGYLPSKLHLVPKSYRKLRSIAIEPPGNMWVQQAVFKAFDRAFLDDPALHRRIRLHDASANRHLAQRGSVDGSFATIDLSHASDDVSWKLVKSAFAHTPWLPWIWACRTREVVLPDGTLYPLRSHASMGSALCFPVECVVFMACVEAAITGLGDDPDRSKYLVYGDDIVVETRYALAVEDKLEQIGFTINRDKSFNDYSIHPYRESCGGEYMNGVDVTPLRISRRFTSPSYGAVTPAQFESLVELSNETFERFPTVRSWCLWHLDSLPRGLRPLFGEPGVPGVVSSWHATNYHLDRHQSFTRRFQRPVYVSGVVSADHARDPSTDTIGLFDWFRSSESARQVLLPGVELPVSSTVTPPQVPRLRRKART